MRLYCCQKKNPLLVFIQNFLGKLKKSEEKDHKWMDIEIYIEKISIAINKRNKG